MGFSHDTQELQQGFCSVKLVILVQVLIEGLSDQRVRQEMEGSVQFVGIVKHRIYRN